jgi:hypothetical protein
MEDSHSFVYDYCGIRGQGYFAVFEWVYISISIDTSADLIVATQVNTLQSGVDRTFTR